MRLPPQTIVSNISRLCQNRLRINNHSLVSIRRLHNGWSQAMEQAQAACAIPVEKIVDPKELVGKDIEFLTDNIRDVLSSGHPVINTISNYYFKSGGKHIRPLLVLLMAQACSPLAKGEFNNEDINLPLNNLLKPGQLREKDDFNTYCRAPTSEVYSTTEDGCFILPTQRRLAEISEMIHTASLFHDDVVDDSALRRGNPSVNAKYGNKMAILGGDFLLARSSVALARLRNPKVIELLATVIANLVEGELLQIKDTIQVKDKTKDIFGCYIEKSYLKTASLIAKSCQASAILGNTSNEVSMIAYEYGKNIGIAFQLIDDMLDFVVSADEFGKPVGADLELGLTTAPVLFAWEEYPALGELIERKFSQEGDVQKVREMVFNSQGLIKTKELALKYSNDAIQHIQKLPPTQARNALILLAENVILRKK
ncbi:terpenoid synthase [Neoconidiobolus thromboides FSU 785]|nr:terpenoid synthase [Neoconidiobolus thromboides FSU 785]